MHREYIPQAFAKGNLRSFYLCDLHILNHIIWIQGFFFPHRELKDLERELKALRQHMAQVSTLRPILQRKHQSFYKTK